MNYTKGEWKATGQLVTIPNKKEFKPTPQHPKFIIVQTALYTSPSHEQCTANAHLIASSPEMYEALKAIQQGIERGKERLGYGLEEQLNQAIAKAEGK